MVLLRIFAKKVLKKNKIIVNIFQFVSISYTKD